MERIQQPRRGTGGVAVVLGATVLSLAIYTYKEIDDMTVSPHDVQDAIYTRYGECLANEASYALGHVAVEYVNDIARLTSEDAEVDVLVFMVPRSASNRPLPRPDGPTEVVLVELGCEMSKPLWES